MKICLDTSAVHASIYTSPVIQPSNEKYQALISSKSTFHIHSAMNVLFSGADVPWNLDVCSFII